ncbi:MAG: aspartate/glutamate racemase family protein [Eubacterium sp.]|nr:aspartate/glutamate racemase family protein [Eubacterium sp.]
MNIGIFDSGIGGLSVLHEAYHMLPTENYIFYADTAHVPYGLKTPAEIESYAEEITRFLIDMGADAIVVACNTATSVAIKELRHHYDLPIIGMEPAVKPAVEYVSGLVNEPVKYVSGSAGEQAGSGRDKADKSSRVLVMATPVTISEEKLRNLLIKVDGGHIVDLLPMPRLVSFAESEEFESEEVEAYLAEQFAGLAKDSYAAVVLGCTHFNYFKPLYGKYFREGTVFVDGNHGTIKHVAEVLGIKVNQDAERTIHFNDIEEMALCGNTRYFASGVQVMDIPTLEHFKRLHNRLELVRNI